MPNIISIKVTANTTGIFRGHCTGEPPVDLSDKKVDAIRWASEKLHSRPGSVLALKSVVTWAEILKHRRT